MPMPFDEFIITQTGFDGNLKMPLQPCDLTLGQFIETLYLKGDFKFSSNLECKTSNGWRKTR